MFAVGGGGYGGGRGEGEGVLVLGKKHYIYYFVLYID